MTTRLLALDIDETLLLPQEVLQNTLLDTVCDLLRADVKLAVLTDNDYVRSIRRRVVEPIPSKLRSHLVVYADGCTRKMTYNDEGVEHRDGDYHAIAQFDPDDKAIIVTVLLAEVDNLAKSLPEAFQPNLLIDEGKDGKYHICFGPINTNNDKLSVRCDRFQRELVQEITQNSDVELLPSDPMWVKIVCPKQTRGYGDSLREIVETTFRKLLIEPDFLCLSKPTIIDRGEQISLKPIKPASPASLKPESESSRNAIQTTRHLLITRLKPKLTGSARQTNGEYQVLAAGRTTINVQRQGIDKSSAMRDFIETHQSMRGEVLYFGDAFGENGGDRLVTRVKGVQCISVGDVIDLPEIIVNAKGGPPVTLACLQSILWALTMPPDT